MALPDVPESSGWDGAGRGSIAFRMPRSRSWEGATRPIFPMALSMQNCVTGGQGLCRGPAGKWKGSESHCISRLDACS